MVFRSIGPRGDAVKRARRGPQTLAILCIDVIYLFNIAFTFFSWYISPQRTSGEVLMVRSLALLLVIFAAMVCSSGSAFGQGTDIATVRGPVTDTGSGVKPNAGVLISDDLTNATRETRTNSQGDYEVVGLNAGTYTVTITAPEM